MLVELDDVAIDVLDCCEELDCDELDDAVDEADDSVSDCTTGVISFDVTD